MDTALAIIGGSGLYVLQPDAGSETHAIATPYSSAPVILSLEQGDGGPVWFLPRHGRDHSVAPHEINYRANLWALREVGVRRIVAVNAVGSISPALEPGALLLPDQLIDYSWGREHTFFSGQHAFERHVDFTWPYSETIAGILQQAAARQRQPLQRGGCYACTQGPRLETAAEIRRLAQDGCDIVGMTGMPEAGLARELALEYGCLALVVNRAAGLQPAPIGMDDIRRVMETTIGAVRRLLLAALPQLRDCSSG